MYKIDDDDDDDVDVDDYQRTDTGTTLTLTSYNGAPGAGPKSPVDGLCPPG